MISDRPVRRLVTIDDPDGRSRVLLEGPPQEVLRDPARPGFTSSRLWATDATPAAMHRLAHVAAIPDALEPPPGGSVFHLYTLPPDAAWIGKVNEAQVREWFASAGSPQACRYRADGPHPYLQQTRTLDLCVVLEGTVTLVLEKEEVTLEAGATVVQRATCHAWSNRGSTPCVIAVSSHDAARA